MVFKDLWHHGCLAPACLTLSAFGKETLNNGRWLVGAGPNSSGCNALWHSILTVDAEKQVPGNSFLNSCNQANHHLSLSSG